MRILMTGVSGQVGGALVARLPASATVLAADRSVLDLAAPQTIAGTLDRLAPDIIVNAAAYTAVDKAEDEPDLAMRVNAEAPGVIARWAAARGVPLIHFSTDYVFDGSGERAWREDDQPRPLSVYGATKLFQDDPHWRDLILFYEYFHGDNGAGLGASHQTGWTALVSKLIEQSGDKR